MRNFLGLLVVIVAVAALLAIAWVEVIGPAVTTLTATLGGL